MQFYNILFQRLVFPLQSSFFFFYRKHWWELLQTQYTRHLEKITSTVLRIQRSVSSMFFVPRIKRFRIQLISKIGLVTKGQDLSIMKIWRIEKIISSKDQNFVVRIRYFTFLADRIQLQAYIFGSFRRNQPRLSRTIFRIFNAKPRNFLVFNSISNNSSIVNQPRWSRKRKTYISLLLRFSNSECYFSMLICPTKWSPACKKFVKLLISKFLILWIKLWFLSICWSFLHCL